MFRLVRFLPLALPFIVRFFRSPRGKSLIARFRGGGGGDTPGTPPRR